MDGCIPYLCKYKFPVKRDNNKSISIDELIISMYSNGIFSWKISNILNNKY